MPWVAALALVGTLAIAGLPPLNGFVSEWLLLQAFLFTPGSRTPSSTCSSRSAPPHFALTVALAGYVMVKFYGVIFLGQPREASLAEGPRRRPAGADRPGLAGLGCVALGAFPQLPSTAAAPITRGLLGAAVRPGPCAWAIAPVAPEAASYSGLVLLVGILGVVGVTFVAGATPLPRPRAADRPGTAATPGRRPGCRTPPRASASRSGTSSVRPSAIERELPSPWDSAPRYRVHIEDRLWRALYVPLARGVQRLADAVAVVQGGRLAIYLLYASSP